MAITNFIRTIWDAELKQALSKKLVSQYFVNHNYEGAIMGAGSVKINQLADVTLRDYNGNDITTEDITTTAVTLNIDHEKYFSVKVDDVDTVQAAGDLRVPLVNNGATKIAEDEDAYVFSTMAIEGTLAVGTSAAISVKDAASAKAFLLKMKTAADKANVPAEGRVFVAPYEFENYLLSDTTINLSAPKADETLKAGYIGKLYGIEIYSSNNCPSGKAILTTPQFTTEARQLQNIEAIRSENSFKDIIRGLAVSGVKVTQAAGVIVGNVSFQ